MTRPTGYRPDIDGLRAFAVTVVVLYHAAPDWLRGGFAGVDAFFVISGFLITRILLSESVVAGERRGALSTFYARRIRRLFPALVVVSAASLALGALFLLPADYAQLGRHTAAGAAFVANLVLWQDVNYFAGVAEAKPLLHLWSLGIEEQFYLLWPFLLWLPPRRRGVLLWVLGGVTLASLIASGWLSVKDPTAGFYAPWSRFWELGAGGLLAVWSLGRDGQTPGPSRRADLLSWLGVALLAVTLIVARPDRLFPMPAALLPVAGALLLIAAGPHAWVNRRLLSRPAVVWLGRISYPLYLWHWPMLSFLRVRYTDLAGPALALATAAAIAASVLLAWLTYRYIEQPIRHARNPGRRTTGLLAAAMVATAGAGVWIWSQQGLAQRLPESVRTLASAPLLTPAWHAGLRDGICHNMIYRGNLGDPATCFPAGHPSALLWGDSHAAALFAGMATLPGWSMQQATTDATAPLFGTDLRNNLQRPLDTINTRILQQVSAQPPDLILLHAFWEGYKLSPEALQRALVDTVERIRRAAPGSRVVVLGPVPVWRSSLQQNLLNYARGHDGALAPAQMAYGQLRSSRALDQTLQQGLAQAGVDYISLYPLLCQDRACLARRDATPEGLAYVDGGHLSLSGATTLAQRLLPLLQRDGVPGK